MTEQDSSAASGTSAATERDTESIQRFCKALHVSGLMDEATIKNFWNGLSTTLKPRTGDELAEELIRQRRITPFQYQRLRSGEVKSLKLDQYTIVDQIGVGGMGEVLKARHEKMQRYVAVKLISAKWLDSPEALERFEQEARAAAQLSHPNIVAAYDAGEKNGTHYLVMEFVDGQDLASITRRSGVLRVALAIDYILQAAEGLQYSHRKGIVHRDIKPANLLVDSSGVVKILDMGLAFFTSRTGGLDDTADLRLTRQGEVMGTCSYMAPEQALDVRKADARSDIYSLGCTLYELLVGNPPYRGETQMAIIVAHREEPIPSICAHRSEVPVALDKVFQKMVAKKPEQRYTSMSEVIAALRGCLHEQSTVAGFSAGGGSSPAAVMPAPVSAGREPAARSGGVALQEKSRGATAPAPEETLAFLQTNRETVRTRTAPSSKPTLAQKLLRPLPLTLVALGALSAAALAIFMTVRTSQGTLVIESDDPSVKVLVKQKGDVVEIVDASDNWTVRLKEGQYEVEAAGGKNQFQLDQKQVVVSSGQTERLRATFRPKEVAAAEPGSSAAPDQVPAATPEQAVVVKPQTSPPVLASTQQPAENANVRTAADGQLVISQEVGDDHLLMPPWQFFKAPADGTITQIDLQPNAYGGIQGNFSIYAGEGPQGKPLYTSKYSLPSLSNTPWASFQLTEPLAVEAGKTYTWELTGAKGLKHANSDRYADGGMANGTIDYCFRIYIQPAGKASEKP